jgi:flagellar biosynthesis protein FliQ
MKKSILIIGDILTILIITFIGFASHGEAGLSFLPRMLAIFLPLALAWFVLSPFLGLFQQEIVSKPNQLWRPAMVMIFAGPFAVVVRGLLLNTPIIPIFAVVLSFTSAFGVLIWRAIILVLNRK